MKIGKLQLGIGVGLVVGVVVGTYLSHQPTALPMASANETIESSASPNAIQDEPLISPTKPRERDVYYPNSEELGADEMRVIACGTGMPTTRAAQAAACFLVELGNGDKFLFDIGTGSAERISSLQIPYDFLDKVFIGHLHADHFGSLPELFIGGALMGRQRPLRVWGPSGPAPELGTAYAGGFLRARGHIIPSDLGNFQIGIGSADRRDLVSTLIC